MVAGAKPNRPAMLEMQPPEAKAAGAAGAVVLDVTIDRSSFVRDAAVMLPMGHGLSESAVEAVKQWQFEPSLRQGVPVEVVQEVRIEFKP